VYGQTPFQVAGPVPTQGASVESRMQSTRVFALVAAAFAMLCMAVVAAGLVVWWQYTKEDTTEVVAVAAPVTGTTTTKVKGSDTGLAAPKAKAPQTPKKTPSTPNTPTAPKLGATGSVSISFSGAQVPGAIEITCNSGYRDKRSLSGGAATFAGVSTASGDCKAYPKGGVVGTSFGVRGGGSYSCTISGTTTSCH
jgi:hypothetical protein